MALLSVLGAGAAVVHYKFVPLDVLVTWPRPAWLTISSDPGGAEVKLDGRTLAEPTPTRVEVRRDFQDHVLELSHAGSHSVRTTVRFDRTVVLSQAVSLPPLPPEPPPPPPVAVESPPPAPVKVAVAEVSHPATRAEMKAAKKAAKAAAKQAKRKSKKKKNRKTATQRGGESTETANL